MKIARLVVLSALVSLGLMSNAFADRPDPRQVGYIKCIDWCQEHNKTVPSYRACSSQCLKYWKPPHPVTSVIE